MWVVSLVTEQSVLSLNSPLCSGPKWLHSWLKLRVWFAPPTKMWAGKTSYWIFFLCAYRIFVRAYSQSGIHTNIQLRYFLVYIDMSSIMHIATHFTYKVWRCWIFATNDCDNSVWLVLIALSVKSMWMYLINWRIENYTPNSYMPILNLMYEISLA